MRPTVCLARTLALLSLLAAADLRAQELPPLTLVHPEGPAGPPMMITLQDALTRARQNDAQFQASAADANVAREERAVARAGLLPAFSYTTQYLGNQGNGVNPNGRFVSLDGVNMYRAWAVVHQELSANAFMRTPLQRATANDAAAQARVEIASRGLAVTVTRAYYALVVAQRKYAAAQDAAQQSGRFLQTTQQQERLGQVAHSDVVKAEIQYRQLQQTFRDALVAVDNARLSLAVMLFPSLNENFAVVDDLAAAPALPPFSDVRTMAAQNNPDVRAADQSLRAASQEVRAAKNAFFPNLTFEGVYGIEANEFALHSRIAAQPELGVLPNLGYFVTVNLTVPVWDWGNLRAKLHQSETRQQQAQFTLTLTQRQTMGRLYSLYNEALSARSGMDNQQRIAELAAESLRLTTLRYQAGESTALEVVDAQNTLVQTRSAADDAQVLYRVTLAELQTLTGPF